LQLPLHGCCSYRINGNKGKYKDESNHEKKEKIKDSCNQRDVGNVFLLCWQVVKNFGRYLRKFTRRKKSFVQLRLMFVHQLLWHKLEYVPRLLITSVYRRLPLCSANVCNLGNGIRFMRIKRASAASSKRGEPRGWATQVCGEANGAVVWCVAVEMSQATLANMAPE